MTNNKEMTPNLSVSLKDLTTMHLDVRAQSLLSIESETDLKKYFSGQKHQRKWFVLGGGSNVLFSSDFQGDILHIRIKGLQVVSETQKQVMVRVQAGENWHQFVSWAVSQNLGGIENLALIPGTVGASPIQNIGAYGVEAKDMIRRIRYFDVNTHQIKEILSDECQFGYRDSIFKNGLKDTAIIISVDFLLTKEKYYTIQDSYKAVQDWLRTHQIRKPVIKDIYQAIIEIRKSKLPDPTILGNNGSFFKNPTIDGSLFAKIQSEFREIPFYKTADEKFKIPAGWLIEQAGWKGYREGDAGVYEKQALVLVNYGSAKPSEILSLADKIVFSVKEKFYIQLQTEVNIIS